MRPLDRTMNVAAGAILGGQQVAHRIACRALEDLQEFQSIEDAQRDGPQAVPAHHPAAEIAAGVTTGYSFRAPAGVA